MARTPEYRKYQIKYLVRAIVCKEVIAESFDKAKERADKAINGKLFVDSLDVIDEITEFAGFDDMTTWDQLER